MAEPDHYRTLGVARFAPAATVRRAYVSLMKRHHDGAPRATLSDDRIRRIGQAYWVLRHPDRREEYDARLRQQDRRRAAAGKVVPRRPPARIQLPPVRRGPRPGTRGLFAASLLILAGGVGWTMASRPPLHRPAQTTGGALPATSQESVRPRLAVIDEAVADYRTVRSEGGRPAVMRYIGQCFDDMRSAAPLALFDYCVTLDALGALDPAEHGNRFFDDVPRRERLGRVAFQPGGDAVERWEAINRIVSVRGWRDLNAGRGAR